MLPEHISPELFHFFGRSSPADHDQNYSVLKKALQSGCISHPPHRVGYGATSYVLDLSKSLLRGELLVPTVTCYCDIPYPLLGPHLAKYGKFGLSFSRHFLAEEGGRPVTYVPYRPFDWRGRVDTGESVLLEIETTFRGIHARNRAIEKETGVARDGIGLTTVPETNEGALQKAEHSFALRFIAYLKPFDSLLDESHPEYYYSEREWRKHGNLVFKAEDVRRVVVDASFLDRARNELPTFRDRICPPPEAVSEVRT